MSKKGKLYQKRLQLIEEKKNYTLEEAIAILKQGPFPKFDETVELVFKLGIDPRQSDQAIRGAFVLPHGTGRKVYVVVVASGASADEAKKAGADEVGYEDLLEKIKGGWLEFDTMIATPQAMQQVRTLGRILGPRGLMPNPKTGTVTDSPGNVVREVKKGRVEYRSDRTGCSYIPVGKMSFDASALLENSVAVVKTLLRVRPPSAKGTYIARCTMSATMSPGIHIATRDFLKG